MNYYLGVNKIATVNNDNLRENKAALIAVKLQIALPLERLFYLLFLP